ncbi:hypothetical protein ACWJTP_27795, partial [Klebsiella pneumoniae]
TSNRSTSTTTPHTPATLLNTKKIPFNFSFAQTLVWAKPLFGAKNMAFNPELGSTSPAVLLDNAERLDKLVNGPELTEPDRAGVELDTWRGMMAKNDQGHCCKVSDEAAFCLIQRPYISKTLLTRRISPRGSP